MSPQRTAILERLRRPEYTGENRCIPCTIVNVVLALIASAFVAVVSRTVTGASASSRSRSLSRRLAGLTFVGSLLAIYLRGYLVPGTPTLTKRYLPTPILRAFDSEPPAPRTGIEIDDAGESLTSADETASNDSSATADSTTDEDESVVGERLSETVESIERHREQAVDPEQFLLEVGAVEPCDDADDLCLTDEFEDRVEGVLADHRDTTIDAASVAEMGDIDPKAVTDGDRDYPAFKIGNRIHKWPAEAALLADFAVHRALTAETDRWAAVPSGQRLALLEVMRSFLDACPTCGGEITLTDNTVESCCGSYEVLAMACTDCESPLLEFDPTAVGGNGGIEP